MSTCLRSSDVHSPPMRTTRTIDYRRARSITLLAGLIVIGLVVITMLVRQVDPIEVVATVSFAPIFVGLLLFGWRVGVGLGLAAGGLYVALRLPAIQLVGIGPLLGLLLSRVIGFVAFGGIGGWAAAELGAAIGKLELYDTIDDATGLGNARSVVEVIDRENARATRHSGVFSVVTARFPHPAGRARRARALREVGRTLRGSLRTSDHAAHMTIDGDGVIVLVLPETGPEGAQTVADGLAAKMLAVLGDRPLATTFTLPGDEPTIDELVAAARTIDAAGRP